MEYKSNYTVDEWIKKKQYYINEVNNIRIPREVTPIELKLLLAINNNLLSEAYMDKATVFEALDKAERKLKVLEEECWATIDWKKISKDKLVKEEKNGYIVSYIKKRESFSGMDLYEYLSTLSSRAKFIENVVYTLKDKAGALLNLHSLLKMENEQTKYDGYCATSNMACREEC